MPAEHLLLLQLGRADPHAPLPSPAAQEIETEEGGASEPTAHEVRGAPDRHSERRGTAGGGRGGVLLPDLHAALQQYSSPHAGILACCDCANTICLACFSDYDRKNIADDTVLKCPFCGSTSSMFADYELEPHSYFDTTHKGFLSKEERDKLDAEVPIAELSPNQESGAEMESSNSQVAAGV